MLGGCALPRAPRSNLCRAHLNLRRAELAAKRLGGPNGPTLCAKCGRAPRQLYHVTCRPCWLDNERQKRRDERTIAEKHLRRLLEPPSKEIRTYRQQWQGVVRQAQRPRVREDVKKRFQRVLERALRQPLDGPERDTLYDLGRDEALAYVESVS